MKRRFLALPRYQKQVVAALLDLLCLPLVFLTAVNLYGGAEVSTDSYTLFSLVGAMAACISVPIFIRLGLYRAVIRYVDHILVFTVVRAAISAVVVIGVTSIFALGTYLPLALLGIYLTSSILYLIVSRFVARSYLLGQLGRMRGQNKAETVIIYGAGKAGRALLHALKVSNYRTVAFVDDNTALQGTIIAGTQVHAITELGQLVARYQVSTILLAIPSMTQQEKGVLLGRLANLHVKIKVTPSIDAIINGRARIDDVRAIEIDDLLSRDPVVPDLSLLAEAIRGKCVLVSGAGGSIGSELCRQIIKLAPAGLVLLEMSEYALYNISQELEEALFKQGNRLPIIPCLGTVLDQQRNEEILRTFKVQSVYHAAAYKHVPMVEHNPIEGATNNVFGTLRMARAAINARVERFILVSTDKAVRPTNVMGATKRVSELILQGLQAESDHTRFAMVRFGNVLGSAGSVVPLFRRQIEAGGPITLTHPEMVRFFMSIPEAAQLVLQASTMAQGGDVFLLDMGAPVRIVDLAERMTHLSGLQIKSQDNPQGDIEIHYVGLRPGEKLYEELLIDANAMSTAHPSIMRAQENFIEWPYLSVLLNGLEDACRRRDPAAVRLQLQKLVTEYQPANVPAEGPLAAATSHEQFHAADTGAEPELQLS